MHNTCWLISVYICGEDLGGVWGLSSLLLISSGFELCCWRTEGEIALIPSQLSFKDIIILDGNVVVTSGVTVLSSIASTELSGGEVAPSGPKRPECVYICIWSELWCREANLKKRQQKRDTNVIRCFIFSLALYISQIFDLENNQDTKNST